MLRDYILQSGEACTVIRNDEVTIDELDISAYSSIVISPGPHSPAEAGITLDAIARYHSALPILGICLGHQAIGTYYGARLDRAVLPMHGKTSAISLSAHPIFEGLDPQVDVMRYHSLILTDVPAPLRVIATTAAGEVMAVAHATLPIVGLQFHPESILTVHGLQMIRNWFRCIKSTAY
jgi:anthranilate synthase/aminodeoxychorismate synthase-like glutamine amidotransferase